MEQRNGIRTLFRVVRAPALYGVQDVLELRAFLTGYMLGGDHPDLTQLLHDLTAYIKDQHPEYKDSTADWSHFIKGFSWERGGSMKLFKWTLAGMLQEQGHWTEEHFATCTSDVLMPVEAWDALPIPTYPS